jgi:hypothetical protein
MTIKIKVGSLVLTEARDEDLPQEFAAWHQTVRVAPGTHDVFAYLDQGNDAYHVRQLSATCAGITVSSNFRAHMFGVITEAQIQDLLEDDDEEVVDAARVALGDRPRGALYPRSTPSAIIQNRAARAICADILNGRRECRACAGTGFLAADGGTPHNERLTRDSRACNYCSGRGHRPKDAT